MSLASNYFPLVWQHWLTASLKLCMVLFLLQSHLWFYIRIPINDSIYWRIKHLNHLNLCILTATAGWEGVQGRVTGTYSDVSTNTRPDTTAGCLWSCNVTETLSNATQYWYITLHYITLQYIAIQYITLHYFTLRYNYLHYNTVHYFILLYVTINYITIHCITIHFFTLRLITLHYIAKKYITLHYFTLQLITLHLQYITMHYTPPQTSVYRWTDLSSRPGLVTQL